MKTRGVVVAVLLGLVAVAAPASASAEPWDYAGWGWDSPAGPRVDYRWGEPLAWTRLNDQWRVRDCEGDAPLLCFKSDNGGTGKAELSLFPLTDEDRLRQEIDEHGRAEALRRHANRFYRSFRDDRTGCREGYTFHPFRPKSATVARREGIRYGFVVRSREGNVVERHALFATVTETQLVIVGAEGLNRRGCLEILGPTFTPSALRHIGPYVARLAATGRLPR